MSHRPHILMLISHDTGRHLGCFGASVQTPNLDRLAGQGARFANSYCVAAQCSPSRAALMTGRYPHSNGLMGLTHWGWNLNPDEVCLPAHLNRAGYETHLFGFQHEARVAEELGYQYVHGREKRRIADVAPLVAEFLRSQTGDGPPLFLMVGVSETHRPFDDPSYLPDDPETLQLPPYLPDTPDMRRDLASFHGSVKELDRGVGQILQALDESALAPNTLLIYTTDHGIAFPRAKGMSYDPGLGTALIMRWPGRIRPGTVCREMVTHLDLLPTLLELAGQTPPANLHGVSYLRLLQGGEGPVRDLFFFEMTWHDRYNPHRGIRTNRYKYVRNFDPGSPLVYVPRDILSGPAGSSIPDSYYGAKRPPEELYDIATDPAEQKNLAGEAAYHSICTDLRQQVSRWMEQTEDPLLHGPVLPPPGGRTQ